MRIESNLFFIICYLVQGGKSYHASYKVVVSIPDLYLVPRLSMYYVHFKCIGEFCGNTDSNFFALDPKLVPKSGNLRFGNSKIRETG
jgi:hypothetical protein